jgi:hypothetical protein
LESKRYRDERRKEWQPNVEIIDIFDFGDDAAPHDSLADTQESEPVRLEDGDPQAQDPCTQRRRDSSDAAILTGETPLRDGPAIHTSKTRGESYLVVSDLQVPYEAKAALEFVAAAAREFRVEVREPGRVLCVGDEVDFYHWSRFPRLPTAPHTPEQELEALRDKLRRWYAAFPFVKVCFSNHGGRILKRAAEAQIPEQLIRAHREILDAPSGWEWAEMWRVKASRQPFLVEHGHAGPQSVSAMRQRPALNGVNTVWGHAHAQPGVVHVETLGQRVWGMCVGSLIDRDQIAFEYGRNATWRAVNGIGVVLDGGRTPIWIPYGGSWP